MARYAIHRTTHYSSPEGIPTFNDDLLLETDDIEYASRIVALLDTSHYTLFHADDNLEGTTLLWWSAKNGEPEPEQDEISYAAKCGNHFWVYTSDLSETIDFG